MTETPPIDSSRLLALAIARCAEVERSEQLPGHPCRTVVHVQGSGGAPARQIPEAWSGAIENAKVVYLSSNPSISEAGDHQSGEAAEAFPTTAWDDDAIDSFLNHRFDRSLPRPWVVDDKFRRTDGTLSPRRVAFWREARKRSTELLGRLADPAVDYAMTEVVRCKSKRERGVRKAASHCGGRWLDRTLSLSTAPLVVVVGAKARDLTVPLFDLPQGFGQRGGPQGASAAVRALGGRDRAVVYLPHFTGMEKDRGLADRYGQGGLDVLRGIALGELEPQRIVDVLVV